MAKKRLYEIARELDLESREVLERALEHSTDVIVDPTIRGGKPFRGVHLPIEQILQTAADMAPARRIS